METGTNKTKQKPKYDLWQITAYMLGVAWRGRHWTVFTVGLSLALVTAGRTIAELLFAPAVLRVLEQGMALGRLLAVIGGFSVLLVALTFLQSYLSERNLFGKMNVRVDILDLSARKRAGTSYPNLLDKRFLDLSAKADRAGCTNNESVEAFWVSWGEILTNLFGFGAYLLLLSGLNAWLCLLVCATSVVSYLASRRINEWGYRHREEEAGYVKRLAYVQKVATDRQYGKDIRIFGLREWVEELWESTMRLYHGFLLRRETAYLWANVIDLALLLVRNGAAYAYLIWLTLEQGLPVSQFLLYFGAATGFAQWVSGILEKFAKLHKQCLDISTVREFLEYPEPFRFEDGLPLEKRLDTPYELRLEGVSYRYPGAEKDTIHKLDLTVRPGENLAIVGLNGAGKTTLVKLLCGFLDPTEGRVLLNGQDIRPYNRRDYYKLFAAVFQDFSVLSATVAENVAQCRTGIDEARVWHCLDEAGLTEKVQSLPKQLETQIGREVYEDGIELSGGQTQRLMLARALYKDAPVLVLDEPTAALDPIAENDIYQKYNEMTAGKTSLFISHRLASTRFCDRILYLKDGRVAEEGTHEELLKRAAATPTCLRCRASITGRRTKHERIEQNDHHPAGVPVRLAGVEHLLEAVAEVFLCYLCQCRPHGAEPLCHGLAVGPAGGRTVRRAGPAPADGLGALDPGHDRRADPSARSGAPLEGSGNGRPLAAADPNVYGQTDVPRLRG